MTENRKEKCVIVGSGPAGYTAAIYAARAGMEPLLINGPTPGGLLTTTSEVENFPGYPAGVDGTALTMDLHEQACRFGTRIVADVVLDAALTADRKTLVTVGGKWFDAETVVIATGSKPKWLGAKGEAEYYGSGVSFCAVCDGFFYRGQDVVVVGGGDSAFEEALYLSNICSRVTVLMRGETRASRILQERVAANGRINVWRNTRVGEVLGEGGVVTGVSAVTKLVPMMGATYEHTEKLSCTGVFVAIGHTPSTEPFKGVLEMDADGYIVTRPGSTQTSVPGVFAAGDCQDRVFRQAITAAGTGCMAALEAERYLSHV